MEQVPVQELHPCITINNVLPGYTDRVPALKGQGLRTGQSVEQIHKTGRAGPNKPASGSFETASAIVWLCQ